MMNTALWRQINIQDLKKDISSYYRIKSKNLNSQNVKKQN